jgi:hypothetical protein
VVPFSIIKTSATGSLLEYRKHVSMLNMVRTPSQSSVFTPPVYRKSASSWRDLGALLSYIDCIRDVGEASAEEAQILSEYALSLYVAGQMTKEFERMVGALNNAVTNVGRRSESLFSALMGD